MLLSGYVAVLMTVFWIQALGFHVWLAHSKESHSLVELFLWQWWQPHLWSL